MTIKKGFVIAIDGPVASGKGTIAPIIAKKLGAFYLDTGVFYRCLSLYCILNGIEVDSESAVVSVLPKVKIKIRGESRVTLNNKDVTDLIRTREVSEGSSRVAIFDKVQEDLVNRQREVVLEHINKGKIVVMEGRHTGTATFPEAKLKIFLTARLSIRAQRRLMQWQQKGISNISLAEVAKDIKIRDKRDLDRKKFPLVRNPKKNGYLIIDDSDMTKEETIKLFMNIVKEKGLMA